MLSHLLGGNLSGQDGKFKGPVPVVTEVMASPNAEREPVTEELAVQQRRPPLDTPTKSVRKRQSYFGRVVSGISSWFSETDEHVKEQHIVIRTKVQRELGAGVSGRIFETTYGELHEWINEERMKRVPHKGGAGDRVLIAAQHFAKQVDYLHGCVAFTSGTTGLVFGQCLLLLQLGHENAKALEKAFNLFYQFGLDLRPLLKQAHLFDKSKEINDNLGKAYVSLMDIVTDVAIDLYQGVHGLKTPDATLSVDIFSTSEPQIEAFRSRLQRCVQEMWIFTLSQKHVSDGRDVALLKRWLAPQDSVLTFLASNHINLAARPSPNTCHWLQRPLAEFLRSDDSIMMIEGKTGSGKTTLASWALDRLQRYSSVSSLNFGFNPSVTAQATSLAMLKTLLYQLMEIAIGNVGVYKAVKELYRTIESNPKSDSDEGQLWNVLIKAMEAVDEENDDEYFVIVLDGIDEINSSSKAAAESVSKRIYEVVQRLRAFRIIQFSEPLGLSPAHSVKIAIEDETVDDIRELVQGSLSRHDHFKDRDLAEQEQILDDLKGPMLWSSLACALLRLQGTHSSFTETVQALKASLKKISDIVQKLLTAMQLDAESKLILSWLFAAERPLTLSEINILLRISPERGIVSDRSANLDASLKALAPFIVANEGLVGLRHSAIEQAILSIPGSNKLSLHLVNRHHELLIRLLIYTKACLHDVHRPTFELLDLAVAIQKFHDQRLLEYAVRYWIVHFQKSKRIDASSLELPSDLVAVVPKSVTFALMERLCWVGFTANEAIEMHLLANRVRIGCFGSHTAAVLQSTITCASVLVACDRQSEAAWYYYQAAKISREVLGLRAEITLACCNYLIRVSESLVSKERTTIMTYREETFRLMITIYEHTYGKKSKELLEIYQLLAQLYVFIGAEQKATEVYRIIHEITIYIHGAGSDQDNEVSRHLDVVLRGKRETDTVDTFKGSLFGGAYIEYEEVLTIELISIIIREIKEIIIRGEFSKAEEMYIELWLRITEHCVHVHSVEWHEQKIQIMLLYASFLYERKRHAEASTILICIWQEYENHEFSRSEAIIIVFKEIAVLMKTLSMFTFALSVLERCHSWYKSTRKEHLTIFEEIQVLISETSTEISTRSTTISTSSEIVMREVFESSLTSTEISTTTIRLCESLTSICIKEKRYSEAVSHIEKTIKKSWSFFFAESIQSLSLTSTFTHESISLVVKLIECYINMSRLETAEYYYLRLFRAIKASCKVDDKLFVEYSERILAFYNSYGYYHKAITFYQELLVTYRAFYSSSHAVIVRTLYVLADMCRRYQRTHSYWIEYYLEILTVLNKGSVICHEDAINALVIVANYYYEDCRYSESLQYFSCILATFVKFGKTYRFFENMEEVRIIFESHYRSLQESTTEISVMVSILKEYREACVSVFGHTSTIVIRVTFQLAEVCTRSEKHEFEAISYYEHVLKYSSSSSTEIITKAKTTMRSLYVKQVTTTTTTTVTKEMLESATTLSYEQYIEIKKTYSCTHELVLSRFRELITLYYKRVMTEMAIKELRKLIVECITSVSVAKELIETGTFLAEIFHSCGYVKQGWELIRELRMQLIYKSTKNVSTCGFDVTTIGQRCFSFLAAFEYYLRAEYAVTIADFMAEIIAESLYYDRFCAHIKSKVAFEVVFSVASRLRHILNKRDRLDYFVLVEKETIEYFFTIEAIVAKSSTRSAVERFVSLLLEYFTEHRVGKNFVAACSHAAESRIAILISQMKHREALDLTKCTYSYLMQHNGLDDRDEIGLGFRLALLMSNRGDNRCQDATVIKEMLALSQKILGEVFDICDNENIDLARLQLAELNNLICLVGEHKDYKRLLSLLTTVWNSREGQSDSWSSTTLKKQKLGKRLVQARFLSGAGKQAIRLCLDLVYNVRRVYGVRHKLTLTFSKLLSSMYIAIGLDEIKHNNDSTAKFYFRKAIDVHVSDLKMLVDDEGSGDWDDDDLDSDIGSVGSPSITGVSQKIVTNGELPATDRNAELKAIRDHLRLLKLAFQRAGGFSKPKDIERLTGKIWGEYHGELKMNEGEVLSSKWSANGYGAGKAERSEDNWREPNSWSIVAKN